MMAVPSRAGGGRPASRSVSPGPAPPRRPSRPGPRWGLTLAAAPRDSLGRHLEDSSTPDRPGSREPAHCLPRHSLAHPRNPVAHPPNSADPRHSSESAGPKPPGSVGLAGDGDGAGPPGRRGSARPGAAPRHRGRLVARRAIPVLACRESYAAGRRGEDSDFGRTLGLPGKGGGGGTAI